jgi:deoxyribonuclease-1-like protein
MKITCIFIIFFVFISSAQTSICSWNIKDIGKTKSDEELDIIANIVKDYDIVLIQEVVAKDGGAEAIARLHEILNTKGMKWDYTLSDPTSSSAYKAERYAYLWKTSKATKIGDAWLEQKYTLEIDREPYFATFRVRGKEFTLANFHAIPKSKQPETEIKFFKFLPEEYPKLNLIFCGDFNCPQSHTVFNPLRKMGYLPVLVGQKTSLKKSCVEAECLASEFDNIYYNSTLINVIKAEVIHFYKNFESLELAGTISDHIPVVFTFEVK